MALLSQTVFHIIGRSAIRIAFLIGPPVINSQSNFHLLNQHSHQGGHPHPEHGSRAACGHCRGNARDIAESYRSSYRCGNGFIWAQQSLVVFILDMVFAENAAQSPVKDVTQVPDLEKSGTDGQIKSGYHHNCNQRRSP